MTHVLIFDLFLTVAMVVCTAVGFFFGRHSAAGLDIGDSEVRRRKKASEVQLRNRAAQAKGEDRAYRAAVGDQKRKTIAKKLGRVGVGGVWLYLSKILGASASGSGTGGMPGKKSGKLATVRYLPQRKD